MKGAGACRRSRKFRQRYETPHRIAKSLVDCAEVLGNRSAAVVREITKLHEEIVRGNLHELAEKFSQTSVKGEIVLVIDRQESESGKTETASVESIVMVVAELEKQGIDRKLALKKAAKQFGLSRSEAYRILQSEKN
jgi:16S rRNA (cytidine1402-2'-O)-methyltransferase